MSFLDILSYFGNVIVIFLFSFICEISLLLVGVIHIDHDFWTAFIAFFVFLFAISPALARYNMAPSPNPETRGSAFKNLFLSLLPISAKTSWLGSTVFLFLSASFLFFFYSSIIYANGSALIDQLGVDGYIHYVYEARNDQRVLALLLPGSWGFDDFWVGEYTNNWELYEAYSASFDPTPSGLILCGLTAFLYTVLLYSLTTPPMRTGLFYFFYLISIFSLFICFLTDDFFVFYLSFEFILVPFFVIVGVWGSRVQRLGAAFRLVFFTILFSLPLVTIIFINLINETFAFSFDMLNSSLFVLGYHFNVLFYIASFFAFAVKIPLFPTHIWLPEAHGEAPTFGSVLLAGILLKLGGFGFLRVGFPLFFNFSFDSCINFFPFVYTISVLTILYSNLSVFTQVDIKKTIAYYSIGHMGFVTLGLCTGSYEGFTGAITIMVAHGLSAAGLFFLVGYLYEKTHTRALFAYRGVATTAPIFAFFLFIFICANMGLPGTINFVGEQLVLVSLIKYHYAAALLPLAGILLNGISSILFINRLLFGEVNPLVAGTVSDVRTSELLVFSAVGFPLVFFGFFPTVFTTLI